MSADALHQRFAEMLGGPPADLSRVQDLYDEACRALGEDHPLVGHVAAYRATVLAAEGRAPEALAELDGLIQRRLREDGPGPEASYLLEEKALVLEESGREEEAIQTLRTAAAGWAGAGQEHAEQGVATRLHLATSLLAAGRPLEAVTETDAVLLDADRALGPQNPLVLEAQSLRATALLMAGDHDGGARSVRRVLLRLRHFFGPDSAEVAAQRRFFATVVAGDTAHPEQALALLDELAKQAAQASGASGTEALAVRGLRAELLRRTGQETASRETFEDLVEAVVADPTEANRQFLVDAALGRDAVAPAAAPGAGDGMEAEPAAETGPDRAAEGHRAAHDRLRRVVSAYREAGILGTEEELLLGLFAADELRYAGDFNAAIEELEGLAATAAHGLGAEHPLTEQIRDTLVAARAGIGL